MFTIIIIALAALGLAGASLCIMGALAMLAWAMRQGFIGLAAYIAAWVFLFPIMVVLSLIAGVVAAINMRAEHRERITLHTRPGD